MSLIISTERLTINETSQSLFDTIKDLNNLQQFLVSDKIKEWKSDGESCSFKIQGMANIGMKIKELNSPNSILLESYGKNPFDFTLNIQFEEVTETTSICQLTFDGNVNPFMKVMVEKPLSNFFSMINSKIKEKYS